MERIRLVSPINAEFDYIPKNYFLLFTLFNYCELCLSIKNSEYKVNTVIWQEQRTQHKMTVMIKLTSQIFNNKKKTS